MRFLIIGGSDAGISAALRALEMSPDTEIDVLLEDDFPDYSICGLPFYLSGETPDWHSLAHRTVFAGINLHRQHRATEIDPFAKAVTTESVSNGQRSFFIRQAAHRGDSSAAKHRGLESSRRFPASHHEGQLRGA